MQSAQQQRRHNGVISLLEDNVGLVRMQVRCPIGLTRKLERMRLKLGRHLVLAGVALILAASQACAYEHVTLRNGFEMSCHHHAEAAGKVRLFLSKDDSSYIEVTPNDIAAVETLPDPPAPKPIAPTSPKAGSGVALSTSDLRQMLDKAGAEHNLDVDLLASVVKAESGGNAHAVSRTGARGLMQLMPGTASDLGVSDSFMPDQNVRGGSTYLDSLLTRYHENMALALAAYNAGPAAVDKYHGVPPYRETRLYVARVIHEFNRRVLARQAQSRRALATAMVPAKSGQ